MTTTGLNPYAAMSLATIAYDDEGGTLAQQKVAMSADLSNLSGPAEGPWSLMWGPAANDGILAFVALNAAKTQYAVAVRGSLSDEDAPGFIANWFDDFDALAQVPWLYPQTVSGVVISSGLNDALALLMGATDPATDLTLIDYLRTALAGANAGLMVAGHSLGGALATLLVADVTANTPLKPQAWTFASPRVGDAIFAARYGGLSTVSWRIYNLVDVVPYFPIDTSGGYQPVTTGYAINSLGKAHWSLGCAHSLNTYLHVLSPATVPLDPACKPGS